MVVFICNHCGESLKKQVVDKHAWKCKREINVSCMDCLKDFPGKTYDAHTSCISEQQKYSDKSFVPKVNKGAKKQEDWVAMVREIMESKQNLPQGVLNAFEVIKHNENIPRKLKGFQNYFRNSARHIRQADVEAAWALIEEEKKRQYTKPAMPSGVEQKPAPEDEATAVVANNQESAKRKLEEEPQPTKQKKRKAKDEKEALLQEEANVNGNGTHVTEEEQNTNGTTNGTEKFHWNEVIRNLLSAKNNEMKLSKLKTKVLKRYRQFTNTESSDDVANDGKLEKKLNKKLSKGGFVVENDKVRLVE